MNGNKVMIGIIIAMTVMMLGGTVGIAVSYYMSINVAQAEGTGIMLEDDSEDRDELEELEEQQSLVQEPKDQANEYIDIDNRTSLEEASKVWKQIIEQTAHQKLDYKSAGKLIYRISSETYQRNIPESLAGYRLINIRNSSNGPLKEVILSEPQIEEDAVAYIAAKEVYENHVYSYRIKWIMEKGQWCFAAQIVQE